MSLCQYLIDTFDTRVRWVADNQGHKYHASYKKKLDGQLAKVQHEWIPWNDSLTVENVSFNHKKVLKLNDDKLGRIQRRINKARKQVKAAIQNHPDFNKKNMKFVLKKQPSYYTNLVLSHNQYEQTLLAEQVVPLESYFDSVKSMDKKSFISNELRSSLLTITGSNPRLPPAAEDDLLDGSTDEGESFADYSYNS